MKFIFIDGIIAKRYLSSMGQRTCWEHPFDPPDLTLKGQEGTHLDQVAMRGMALGFTAL